MVVIVRLKFQHAIRLSIEDAPTVHPLPLVVSVRDALTIV